MKRSPAAILPREMSKSSVELRCIYMKCFGDRDANRLIEAASRDLGLCM